MKHRGFSLPELLIVITILAIIVISSILLWRKQIDRGYDVKRKTDVQKIAKAFEEYYNDKGCYPPQSEWDAYSCADTSSQSFLKKYIGNEVPCDPESKDKYMYISIDANGASCAAACGQCSGYRLLAYLRDLTDMDIWNAGCNPTLGCGFPDKRYNWGISVGGNPYAVGFYAGRPPGATPTPTPVYPPGDWFCTSGQTSCQKKTPSCGSSLRSQGCIGFADVYAGTCSGLCGGSSRQYYLCTKADSCN